MVSAPCGCCGATTGDDAHLCPGCTNQLATALAELPALVAELTTAATRQTAMPTSAITAEGCTHEGDCGCGQSLPWGEHASRLRHRIRNALTTWTRCVADDCGIHPAAGDHLATWLIGKLGEIRHQPWAPDMHADITRLRNQAEAAIDQPVDRLYAGPCDGHIALDGIGIQQCGRRLWAKPEESAITCRACGKTHIVADRQAFMLRAAEDLEMHGVDIASALTLMLRRRITPGAIRQWDARGKLTAKREDSGRKWYRFGDVHALAVRGEDEEARTA